MEGRNCGLRQATRNALVAEVGVVLIEDGDADECTYVAAAHSLLNLRSRSGGAYAGRVLSRRGRKFVLQSNRARSRGEVAVRRVVSSDNPRCVLVHLRPSARVGGRRAVVISAVVWSYFVTSVMTTVLTTASSTTRCAARRLQQKERGICRHEVAAKQAAKAKVTGRFLPHKFTATLSKLPRAATTAMLGGNSRWTVFWCEQAKGGRKV
jgi:hypothetical protein